MSKKKSKKGQKRNEYISLAEIHEIMNIHPPDEEPQKSVEPGVFLGKSFLDDNATYVMPLGRECHMVVFGASGSGKTSGIAIPTLRTWSAPMFVTDIKGELSLHYADLYRKGIVKRPYIIFDPLHPGSLSYDPFWWLMEDDESNLYNNIEEIALALIPEVAKGNDVYWERIERSILSAALLHFYNLGLSFSETMCKITSTTASELCKTLKASTDEWVKIKLGEVYNFKSKNLAGIDKGLRDKVISFADVRIAHALRGVKEGAHCFSWNDLKEYNIFLRIPEHLIVQWREMVNLIYSQLIHFLERRPDIRSGPEADAMEPILLLMDEFPRFGKINSLPDAISTLRSKKVNICLIVQSVAQIDKIYGEYDRRIILDNCGYKVILGANDAETQEYLSKIIGTRLVLQRSFSDHMDEYMDYTGYSQTKTENREPIIFPAELAHLTNIVLITPEKTCKIKKFTDYTNIDMPNSEELIFGNEVIKMLDFNERLKNANHRIGEAVQRIKSFDGNKYAVIGEIIINNFPQLQAIDLENSDDLDGFKTFVAALSADPAILSDVAESVNLTDFFGM